jgi:hypothetical protein
MIQPRGVARVRRAGARGSVIAVSGSGQRAAKTARNCCLVARSVCPWAAYLRLVADLASPLRVPELAADLRMPPPTL